MNVRRGFFRAWIVVSGLWCLAIIALAVTMIPDVVKGWKYQYIAELRADFDFGKAAAGQSFYQMMRSPSVEKLQLRFSEIGFPAIMDMDKNVQNRTVQIVKFPDGSSLYQQTEMTTADKELLAQKFWEQRWERWGSVAAMWSSIAFGPPAVLFLLGYALLWIFRGFKADA